MTTVTTERRPWSSPETADRVLAVCEANMDTDRLVPVGIRAMADELRIGRQTAHCALSRLVDEGRLEVVRKGTGDGYPNIYRVVATTPVPRFASRVVLGQRVRAVPIRELSIGGDI